VTEVDDDLPYWPAGIDPESIGIELAAMVEYDRDLGKASAARSG
jgi:hypothetical protein